jgi:hypothetical protein
MTARPVDVVRGDHLHNLPIRIAQNILRDEKQRATLFVRLILNIISEVAEEIE